MPYLKKRDRDLIDKGMVPSSKGELNYKVTMEAIAYVQRAGVSYSNISEAISALTDAAAEMRRRLLDPYEDGKSVENGDVYPPELLREVNKALVPERYFPGYHAVLPTSGWGEAKVDLSQREWKARHYEEKRIKPGARIEGGTWNAA